MARKKKTPAGWRPTTDLSDDGKRWVALLQYSNGWRCAYCWKIVRGVRGWMPMAEALRKLGSVEALPVVPDVYEGAVADLARRINEGVGHE